MEAMFAAGALLHPIALAMLAAVLVCTVSIAGQSRSLESLQHPKRKLAWGLLLVFAVAIVVAAASAYVSPEESRRLGVKPENYISVLRREFLVFAVLFSYSALVGCCVVGVPLLVALASRRMATTPVFVLASVPVSFAFLAAVGLVTLERPARAAQEAAYLVGLHALLALAFAIGMRLPWRTPRNEA